MKVTLEGVQCINKSVFEFPESGLSLILGDNAVGKSSIVRGIIAAIAYDPTNKDPHITGEQKLLGMFPDGGDSNLGIIQVGRDEAMIELKNSFIDESVVISRKGRFKGSNPKFVITNVLSDVSWIMRILTHTTADKVSDYLKGFNDLIVRYDDVIDKAGELKLELLKKIQDLNRMLKESGEAQRKISEKRNELSEISDGIRAIQEKKSKEARKDPDKEQRIQEINRQISEKEKAISQTKKQIEELRKKFLNTKSAISDKEELLYSQNEQRSNILEKIKEYEEVDIDSISSIEEKIEDLKSRRAKEQLLFDILKRTYSMLEAEKTGSIVCPLCGSNNLDAGHIDEFAKEKDATVRGFDSDISKLSREAGDLREIAKRRESLTQQLPGLENNIRRTQDDLAQYKNDVDSDNSLIDEKEEKKADLERRRDNLEASISGDDPNMESNLKSMQEKRRELEQEIKDLELSKKYSQISIFGVNYSVDTKTLDIFDKGVMRSISDIEERFMSLREIEETKLKDDFNKNIKEILKEMSFDLDIYIDNNFNILARKKSKNGFKILETQNLSRSEQATIALTLQLAVAKGYAPNTRVILCDGVYEYFDEDRRKKILSYVNNFGKKADKLIIMTVVKEGLTQPTVGVA